METNEIFNKKNKKNYSFHIMSDEEILVSGARAK